MSRRQGKRDRRDAAAAAGAAVGDDTAAAGAAAVGDYDAAAVAAGDAAGRATAGAAADRDDDTAAGAAGGTAALEAAVVAGDAAGLAAAVAAGDAAGFAVAEWLLVNAGLTDAVTRAAYYTGWWARGYWGLPFQDCVHAGHLAASVPPPGLDAPAVRLPPVFVRPS